MPDLIPYGATDISIPFRITLSGVPVNVTLDSDLVDGDIYLIKWTSGTSTSTRQVDVSAEITKVTVTVGSTNHYTYFWTPASAADTQCKWAQLVIQDVSDGGVFDSNSLVIYTGGNANAFYNGT